MAIADPVRQGLARGWRVIDASTLAHDVEQECDVAIVGTGAGGGTAAEILAEAGLSVVLIEEGPLRSSSDFHMREREAYPELYQESAARKTGDKAINILQGRCVGGGTTVNWTSAFRTPAATLARWRSHHGVRGFDEASLAPWFARMEARLGVAPWTVAPNANNAALARAADALRVSHAPISRNVRGCWNLGYCGLGCPTNAKQSMLVTTIPAALDRGATLFTRLRALRLVVARDRIATLECAALAANGVDVAPWTVRVRARAFVAAAGAINTPALLLRSALPDPHALVGKRTFLHPTVVSAATMPERIDPFAGAPQSVYSDQWLDVAPDGPVGYKLEAPPVHPILAAITLPDFGAAHAARMAELPRWHVLIALLRDGFAGASQGGVVRLRDDGAPLLDYPLDDYLWDGVRRAMTSMAELQFAAGAREVVPVHARGFGYRSFAAARDAIARFDLAPRRTPVVSAHVMGGAPFGSDSATSVVGEDGRHHEIANLYVMDGSLFPTSIGANPQLSIFAIVARLADGLARALRRAV
jgi:choline dehydrogenase-like flavoprotein